MKFLLVAAVAVLCGCTSPGGVVLNPLQAAGCDVETAVTGAFGGVIVNQCAGTDQAACANALLTALGNVNMCAQPVPSAPTLTQIGVKWKTIGDIKKGDLDKGKMSMKAVQTQGVIGGIVCPLAYNTITGLLTGVVPKACGCTKNIDAGALGSAIIAACVAAVPI